MASSSTTAQQWKYDVLLSFRGKDTRGNFTSHLCDVICRKQIKTFIDNDLERGEEIEPTLLEQLKSEEFQ
jgi:hypothetical protein